MQLTLMNPASLLESVQTPIFVFMSMRVVCLELTGCKIIQYILFIRIASNIIIVRLAWRPRPIPHAKWRLSGKGLVSAGKGHVLVHDFMDNE